ncbi:CxxH/CxxC protein [Niallia sp. FSL R7-0271]|uniref:CxxH/CxxC protein n=1 Tax=Niallia sp. FSL R7-0271 TaxID=2921678 RepID=UPI0040481467
MWITCFDYKKQKYPQTKKEINELNRTKEFMSMIYSCEEHVDIAIDTIVNEYETFPSLEKIDEEKKLSTTCEYCKNNAIYIVANK